MRDAQAWALRGMIPITGALRINVVPDDLAVTPSTNLALLSRAARTARSCQFVGRDACGSRNRLLRFF